MTEDEFDGQLQAQIRAYAHEHAATGKWRAEEALEKSRAEYAVLLPQGLATPDNHQYVARDSRTGEGVGYFWFALRDKGGRPEAYIYNIQVHEDRRGRGYGRAVLLAGIERAKGLGAATVGLHVFGSNTAARRLYTGLGFQETNVLMSLEL